MAEVKVLDNESYLSGSTQYKNSVYTGCDNVSQLGGYKKSTTNDSQTMDAKESKRAYNKADILNTLIKGSYTPNEVKKCSEFTTSDKKKM